MIRPHLAIFAFFLLSISLAAGQEKKVYALAATAGSSAAVAESSEVPFGKIVFEHPRRIKGTALLEKLPVFSTDNAPWSGTFFADGRRIHVTPATGIAFQPNKTEERQLRKLGEAAREEKQAALHSLTSLDLNTFIHYEGVRQPDGSVLASRVEFQHAQMEKGEVRLWSKIDPVITAPDYMRLQPGEIRLQGKKFTLVPDRDAQAYVERLGERLVPEHQKQLAFDNPLKIPFRFYLVNDQSFNASAYPNGVVIVHAGVFNVLENEAQLAFILSHEITHAIEKHYWRQHEYHRKVLAALNIFSVPIRARYSRTLENQADRIGLEWMLAAGYDIREAPRTWKIVSARHEYGPLGLLWQTHDGHAIRQSQLLAELHNEYADVNYTVLRRDSSEFHWVGERLQNRFPARRSEVASSVTAAPSH